MQKPSPSPWQLRRLLSSLALKQSPLENTSLVLRSAGQPWGVQCWVCSQGQRSAQPTISFLLPISGHTLCTVLRCPVTRSPCPAFPDTAWQTGCHCWKQSPSAPSGLVSSHPFQSRWASTVILQCVYLTLRSNWKFSSLTYSWTWTIKSGAAPGVCYHRSQEEHRHILQDIQHIFWNWHHSLVPAEAESDFRASNLCVLNKISSSGSYVEWEEQQSWSKKEFSNFHFNPYHKLHRKRRWGHFLLCWVGHSHSTRTVAGTHSRSLLVWANHILPDRGNHSPLSRWPHRTTEPRSSEDMWHGK